MDKSFQTPFTFYQLILPFRLVAAFNSFQTSITLYQLILPFSKLQNFAMESNFYITKVPFLIFKAAFFIYIDYLQFYLFKRNLIITIFYKI